MADKSSIEWTEATWNPTTGCDRVSPGCDNCYALSLAGRLKAMGSAKYQRDGDPRTSGPGFGLSAHDDALTIPLRWREPRRVFVNSMSDLFHEQVPDEFIARVFAVMALAPRHTFQVLTKRHGRMRALLGRKGFSAAMYRAIGDLVDAGVVKHRDAYSGTFYQATWPLKNVWLGVSVEDQRWADIRIPALLDTPAAVRWLSCEPLLGPVDLNAWLGPVDWPPCWDEHAPSDECRLCIQPEWVVVGGESGPGARPMHPDWVRSLRDRCVDAGVPFFFKQWGNWVTTDQMPGDTFMTWDMAHGSDANRIDESWRMGKKAAGRLLDGRTWDEYPDMTPAVRRA